MLDVQLFDPWDPAVQADPYPFYAELRRTSPCLNLPGTPYWVVSRYEDVRTVDRDYRRFTSVDGMGVRREEINVLLGADPPEHTKTRRLLQPLFSPKALGPWKSRSEQIADEMLDRAVDAGMVEWRSEFAATLPAKVTGELMGIPTDSEMMETYVTWTQAMQDSVNVQADDARLPGINAAMQEAASWFADFVHARRAEHRTEPRDLTDLMMVSYERGDLSIDNVAVLAMSILAAGLQTTADMLCHMLVVMQEFPDQWESLRRQPELAANAVNELLRYESPQQGLWRTTAQDVEIAGTTVPRNDRVLILLGSANRDDAKWTDPDVFRINRDASDHIGFGFGVHRCIGEGLAKVEGTAALDRIARRVESYEFVEPYDRHNGSIQRGFDRMPVALTGTGS